jgi:PAS domain S-box-containing protein
MIKEKDPKLSQKNQIESDDYDLVKIIDIQSLQSLTDDLYKVTHIVSAVLDLKGNVLVKSGWQDICLNFHRVNPQTLKNCISSDLKLAKNIKQGEYRAYKCQNNLWDIVTPLYIGTHHVGNIYCGQFFYEDEVIDYDFFAAQAEKYGFDKEQYLTALNRVPRLSREQVQDQIVFFTKLAEIVSTMGYSKLKLSRAVADQRKIEKALAKAKDGLEIAVKRRTSELTRANRELQLRATILDKSTEAIILADTDDIFLYANEAAEKLFGYSKEEFIGLRVSDIFASQDRYKFNKWSQELHQKGELSLETYGQRKDKSAFPVETRIHLEKIGQKQFIISAIRDTTERTRVLEKLKQNEVQLENIFDALTEAVSLNDLEGRVIKANASSEYVVRLKPEEIEGRILDLKALKYKVFNSDGIELPWEEAPLFQSIKRKSAVNDRELKYVWQDGITKWVSVNAVPLLNGSGKVTGVVCTTTDITDRKRAEEEKENFTRKLIQVQEEERKRISRDLHDEIAQKLALVSLELDALREKDKHLPQDSVLNLKKMRAMINTALQDVRRFSHELRPSVLEHFGISEALDFIIEEMNLREQTQVTIDVTGSEKRLPEEIEIALFRIAQEALNNIRKHSEATRSKVSLKFSNNKVRLSISDNGKGFDTEKILNRSVKNSLGLLGMTERAQLIGGALKIKSIPEVGTTISVEVDYANR